MKKLLAIVISMAMVLAMLPVGVFAETTNENTIRVTPETVQAILDGENGSISGKTLVFAAGEYDTLNIGGVTADTNGDINLTCNHTDGTHYSFTTAEAYKDHIAENVFHFTSTYTRTMEDVTFVAEGNVTVNGILIESGHLHQKANPFSDSYTGYYMNHNLTNFTFKGIKFKGNVNINTSSEDTVIDGFTFDGCSFTTGGTTSDKGQAIRYYNENNNGNVKNLVVKDCEFKNCYQGVYTMKVKNISVIGCTFDTTGHNAIAVQGENVNHGAVVITDNNFTNIGDRIIRFNTVGSDTQITIKNNNATNSGDKDGEVIKATSLAEGITYAISNNNWGDGKTVANEQFKDSVAKVGDRYFATLAEAVAAAGSDEATTITLLKDVALNETLTFNKNINLDLNGYKISNGEGLKTSNYLVKVDSNAVVSIIGDKEGSEIYDSRSNTTGTITAICVLGELTVKGDNCKITRGENGIAIKVEGELVVENGEISSTQAIQNWGNATIKGGTFKGKVDCYAYGDAGGVLTIENGIFEEMVFSAQVKDKYGNWPTVSAVIHINGGTFKEIEECYKDAANGFQPVAPADKPASEKESIVSVTGGTFSSSPKAYVTGDNKVYKYSDTKYVVSATTPAGSYVWTEAADGEDYDYLGTYYAPSTPTDNVTNTDKITTADLNPTVSDNKATTTVDADTAAKIVDKAVSNKSTEVIVDATGNNTVASSEVGIPETTVKELSEKTDANLVIKTDNGKVDLDKTALDAVAAQAGTTGTVKLVVETVKTDENICHVALKLVTSNGNVTDFKGGNVKVTVSLDKELAGKELVCVYINDNGIYTKVDGVLNADGTYTFTTGHFSEYAVMPKADADKAIAEQLDTLIKEVNLKATTVKTAKKNVKVTVNGDVTALKDAGYIVKYKFYRSTKKASKYTAKVTKDANTYINTTGKKGTKYYYKARVLVYDGDTLVGQTELKQCRYGARIWTK